MSHTTTTAAAVRPHEPRLARVSSRTSGEGAPVTAAPARQRALVTPRERRSPAGQLLRHNLITPEKRTLKRIDALRRQLQTGVDDRGAAVDVAAVPARILELLLTDRGLAGAVADEALAALARRLVEPARFADTAASVVGAYLRAIGGIERSTATPERVKAALALLCDVLYDLDHPTASVPSLVRDLKMERRDGGLQIVAILRAHASDDDALAALRAVLGPAGFGDIDLRAERPTPPAHRPADAIVTTGSTRAI
jgi:hypothetical protein